MIHAVHEWPIYRPIRSTSCAQIRAYNYAFARYCSRVNARMMLQCCQCNSGGKCRNCVCTKAKRQCTNCLPSRKGCCLNTTLTSASGISAPSTLVPAQNSTVSPVNDSPGASTPPPPDLRFSPVSADPTVSLDSHSRPARQSSTMGAPNSAHSLPTLPSPEPLANPSFVWGSLRADDFIQSVSYAYSEVVHWKRNTFNVPYGNTGKKCVYKLSSLYRAYAESSALP